RSTVFATSPNVDSLAFDGQGRLHAIRSRELYRYDASGNATLVATSTGSLPLSGLAIQGTRIVAAEPNGSVLRVVNGANMTPFASGLNNPRRVKLGPDGAPYVANINNGVITRVVDGVPEVYAADLPQPTSLAFGTAGQLFVGGGAGQF